MAFSRLSLLWKILLSTSVAITVLFALTGWIVQRNASRITSTTLEDEVDGSFQAYESLWRARGDQLRSVSLIMSSMSDVRGAFQTGDQATIQDTAGELWARISDENAMFLVTDARGAVIASLGGLPAASLRENLEVVRQASRHFPAQASGFLMREGRLYQAVFTPVYVQSPQGSVLLNVLVAGYQVDPLVAQRLKEATGGSECLFVAGEQVIASTLNRRATERAFASLAHAPRLKRVSDGVTEYAARMRPLLDIEGHPIGDLWILRSFSKASEGIQALRRNIILLWLAFIAVGLGLTYVLARRLVVPVQALDRAAAEVAHQNYEHRVTVASEDELGRLARTFNDMCDSIQQARQELIRQERISTIGRLSSSIVHDLRNPLAAVYGGAEMLVDSDLNPAQVKRLAANIYRASRRIQELLQDLLNVSRGSAGSAEMCKLRDVVTAGYEPLRETAEAQSVDVNIDIPEEIELPLERNRMERVFSNLVGNSLEVMPDGGQIRIRAGAVNGSAEVEVRDTGPGIAPEIRDRLFEPFVSAGKKNGLGLGLALARQTVLDHGGELWADSADGKGACFRLRLPVK